MSKKTVFMILSLVLILSFSGTAFAADPSEAQTEPSGEMGIMLTYISSTLTNLNIDTSGTADCVARIDAYDGVDKVTVSAYLEKYDNGWSTVKHWTESHSGTYYALIKSCSVTEGYLYRLRAYYYAYDGANSESVSDTVYWDFD